jgi:hypothetical protein
MINYIVNKEKRTVVAIMKFEDEKTFKNNTTILSSLVEALENLKNTSIAYSKYQELLDKMCFPKYMSAKAKCSPEDEWDEEYGKKLAHERLVKKIHDYRSNSYQILLRIVWDIENYLH